MGPARRKAGVGDADDYAKAQIRVADRRRANVENRVC
jgi:hypothetical protein